MHGRRIYTLTGYRLVYWTAAFRPFDWGASHEHTVASARRGARSVYKSLLAVKKSAAGDAVEIVSSVYQVMRLTSAEGVRPGLTPARCHKPQAPVQAPRARPADPCHRPLH